MNVKVRPFKAGEEQYVADLHRRLYSEEYSWGPNFSDYAVKIVLDFGRKEISNREELFVADVDGRLVGCIMLCETDEHDIGQLRLFAVEKDCRKFGIGSALIAALMEKAKTAGYQKLILWTASPLTAAIRHYERLGFQVVESVENDTWSTDGTVVYEIKMEKDMN